MAACPEKTVNTTTSARTSDVHYVVVLWPELMSYWPDY